MTPNQQKKLKTLTLIVLSKNPFFIKSKIVSINEKFDITPLYEYLYNLDSSFGLMFDYPKDFNFEGINRKTNKNISKSRQQESYLSIPNRAKSEKLSYECLFEEIPEHNSLDIKFLIENLYPKQELVDFLPDEQLLGYLGILKNLFEIIFFI